MIKRLALFAAAIILAASAFAQSWQGDLDLANIQLAAGDRHFQTAMSAKTDIAAISSFQQASSAYKVAKDLYAQVTRQIEEESARYRWSPRKFTDYGDAQRGAFRADDGISAAGLEMVQRMRNRNGAQSNR